jgi:hypothetical protein
MTASWPSDEVARDVARSGPFDPDWLRKLGPRVNDAENAKRKPDDGLASLARDCPISAIWRGWWPTVSFRSSLMDDHVPWDSTRRRGGSRFFLKNEYLVFCPGRRERRCELPTTQKLTAYQPPDRRCRLVGLFLVASSREAISAELGRSTCRPRNRKPVARLLQTYSIL